MKVLQFITPNGFYGAERWVLALANNIMESEAVVDLAVTKENPNQDLRVAQYYPIAKGNIHFLEMDNKYNLKTCVNQLVEVIKRRNIDVIHTHGYKSDLIGLWAARKTGIIAVSTPHGFSANASLKMKIFIGLGCRALRYFDKVAPLSPELLTDMKRLNVPEEKIEFIENGVDLTESEALPEKQISSKPIENPVIGYVGQMIPRKGLKDLINSFHLVWKQYPTATLKLVGDGEQRNELEQLAQSLPCAASIEFLGFRDDRLKLVQQFDLFCMTSELEGIPRCLMESMSLNTPVVAYKIPGVDQLISHEENGLLATHGDTNELAHQIIRLVKDNQLRLQLTKSGKKTIEERFSARRMALEYIALFKSLTKKD